ncbi:nucleotidyltransferase domain-containing protein [Methanolobus vulcani]|uniref:Nucleotidyltransferase domain-containing protein n=1 Tax=Methanolobus vulcani TaxID=38026 RepID=A0A7Z8P559_9EURY|nr:nucleotidyltransferase domain-containing protein [Methanolobus vulcani]TQD27008.1 nucleotidyltransferase domain-containing protein [Methanolobus vulcani]
MIERAPCLNKEELLPLLREFFRKEESVELAYLFGSVAEDTAGPLSDVDIGVYLSETLTEKERIYKRIDLINELSDLLKSDKLDLIVINDTGYVLNFEIIRPNVLIFSRHEGMRVDVECYIMSMYLDWKYYEDRYNKHFLERITEKGTI